MPTKSDHNAPYHSEARTVYFEVLMDLYRTEGDRNLTFTPPTDRGSLITRAEAYGINAQRRCVPTLVMNGDWPVVEIGANPNTMSRVQREWLNLRWGEVAALWAQSITN